MHQKLIAGNNIFHYQHERNLQTKDTLRSGSHPVHCSEAESFVSFARGYPYLRGSFHGTNNICPTHLAQISVSMALSRVPSFFFFCTCRCNVTGLHHPHPHHPHRGGPPTIIRPPLFHLHSSGVCSGRAYCGGHYFGCACGTSGAHPKEQEKRPPN